VQGIRPGVGFSPQIPQKCAGSRIDPPPSLPTPPADIPAAIAADSPPLEPQPSEPHPTDYWSAIQKIVRLPSHEQFRQFVTPRITAPAADPDPPRCVEPYVPLYAHSGDRGHVKVDF